MINIKEFKEECRRLAGAIDEGGVVDALDPEFQEDFVDIDPTPVHIPTKAKRIDEAIRNEVRRLEEADPSLVLGDDEKPESAAESQARVKKILEMSNPKLAEIAAGSADHLHCLRELNDARREKRVEEVNFLVKIDYEAKPTDTPVTSDEVLLSVAVHHPVRKVKMQEFLVLGSQPLTALMDAIDCPSQFPSKTLFFENVFYEDLRGENAISYADPIIQWANAKERYLHPSLGVFSKKNASDVTFEDLSVTIGTNYLYLHQGDCEHIIVVTDIRRITDADDQVREAYPVQTFEGKQRRRKCRVCDLHAAKWVTYGDRLAAENPCFYCNGCYKPLHYTVTGELLYDDYSVFPYKAE